MSRPAGHSDTGAVPAGTAPDRRDGVAAPRTDAGWWPAAGPLGAWAILLGILAGVQGAFGGNLLPVLVQGGAAALVGAVALAIALMARVRARRASSRRQVPELSLPSALGAVSVAAMLSGATVGSWLIVGGGIGLAAAAGGLLRERRAERRALRAALSTDARDAP
ncbi:MAG: hypothetical protein ACR2OB_14365 [Solirubrobacteraceae bacterium]